MSTLNLTKSYISLVQGYADSVGGYAKQGYGTPGSTVETESGIKETGQAWKENGPKDLEAKAVGAMLGVLADKLNELLEVVNAGLPLEQRIVLLKEDSFS